MLLTCSISFGTKRKSLDPNLRETNPIDLVSKANFPSRMTTFPPLEDTERDRVVARKIAKEGTGEG
jgi:hypothetical protein